MVAPAAYDPQQVAILGTTLVAKTRPFEVFSAEADEGMAAYRAFQSRKRSDMRARRPALKEVLCWEASRRAP